LFVLQECGDFTWRGVSDPEELVGVTYRRWWVVSSVQWEIKWIMI